MSRDFNGTTNYLGTATSSPITSSPWSLSAWVNIDALVGGTFQDIITMYDSPSVNSAVRLTIDVDASDDLAIFLYDGDYNAFVKVGGTLSTGAWTHVAVVHNSSTSYSIFKNGGSKTTGTTAHGINFANLNRVSIGRESFSGGGAYVDGKIAHVAVWNGVALSDSQVAELYTKGPLLVGSPTAYWPLTNNVSPETDDVGSLDLTVNGATYSTSNPSITLTQNPRLINGARLTSLVGRRFA